MQNENQAESQRGPHEFAEAPRSSEVGGAATAASPADGLPTSGQTGRAGVEFRMFSDGSVVDELLQLLIGQRNLRHTARCRVPSHASTVSDLGDFAAAVTASDAFDGSPPTFLLEHDDSLISVVNLSDGAARITTAGTSAESVTTIFEQLRELLLAPKPEEQLTRVTFWSKAEMGPRSITRDIATADWASVEHNYSAGAREEMTRLLALDSCPSQRLILWHGPPGTGKTHALRALARAWAPWCSTHYITDPEKLLDQVASYLLEVVTGREAFRRGQPAPTKLIVLEDSGELMSTTARSEAGQGLSRLLNMTDGLLGQGLELLFLITTNEPLGTLHPAVTRPGRCLAEIEFGTLSVEEANRWLNHQGCPQRVSRSLTLAELYAVSRGDEPRALTRRPIGFAA